MSIASDPNPDKSAPSSQVDDADQRRETIDQILRALRLIFRSVQKHNQWIEDQCGIGGVQLWALWEIAQADSIRVSDVARNLSIHQSTASNLLDKLERQNLVRRERNGIDQRVVHLRLTDKGREVLSSAPPVARNVIVDALQELPKENLAHLDANLALLVTGLKVQDASGDQQPLYRI